MLPIVISKRKIILLPENITEVSGKQFVQLVAVLYSGLPMLQQYMLALRILCGLNMWQWFLIKREHKTALLDHVAWVFTTDISVSKQLLPLYRGFYGVKSELDNLTLSEFYFTELYYSQYKNGDETALNNLCAVLYRPARFAYNKIKDAEGDIRKPFNANLTSWYARKTAKWPKHVKLAIAIFYAGCQAKIAADNQKIFTGSTDESGGEADMFGILRSLSGGRYGDFEKVEKMLLHNALHEMNCQLAENERMEEEMKKQKQ